MNDWNKYPVQKYTFENLNNFPMTFEEWAEHWAPEFDIDPTLPADEIMQKLEEATRNYCVGCYMDLEKQEPRKSDSVKVCADCESDGY